MSNLRNIEISRVRRVLRGDRNQCPTCEKFFSSSFSFSKHRIGEFGKDRRCATTEEMMAKGMALTPADVWVSALREPVEARSDLAGDIEAYEEASFPRWNHLHVGMPDCMRDES